MSIRKPKITVIGAGLGGLEVTYILCRMGYQVTLLEACPQVGGALQSFRRNGLLFDSGFHYVGGLDPEGSLYPLFRYMNLLDLPWQRMDEEASDVVCIGNRSFNIPQGHDRFVRQLSDYFPDSHDELVEYVRLLRSVGDNIFSSLNAPSDLFGISAYDWLCRTISDPLLRQVLSGTSLKLQLDADTLPLYIFAQINNSFIQSSWRLQGGGETLCRALAEQIVSLGGIIRTSARVTRILDDGAKATGVEVNGSETVDADIVISDLHPSVTYSLLPDCRLIRRITRNRIANLRNSFGMFTVNCRLKPGTIPYRNSNLYLYDDDADLWHYMPSDKPHSALVSFYPGSQSADRLDILTPMSFDEVAAWSDSRFGARPDAYKEFKRHRASQLIDFASQHIARLGDSIISCTTSTPLTYLHYTSTPAGSAFGIMKDWHSPLTTLQSPVTSLPGLLLTGQNLNLHGILGVTMTSLFTVSAITGIDSLRSEIGISCAAHHNVSQP